MLVYWSACIISMLFTWFGLRVKHKKNDTEYYLKLSFFSALPFIFIASIRYDVGRDYLSTYLPYFQRLQDGVLVSKMEPIYHLLNVLAAKRDNGYVWVFTCSAVIFFVPVYYHIIKDSPYIYLSIFLLVGTTYLFIFFNGMRQMMGCAILLFSLKYARERKLIKFLLVVILAAGFHKSCLVFALFYFVSEIRFHPLIIVLLTAAVFAGSSVLGEAVNYIVEHTKYASYIGSVFDDGEQGVITMLMNFAILMFAIIFSKNDRKYNQYCNIQMLATWLSILNGEVALIRRIRWIFGIPSCILIPLALKNIRGTKNRVIAGSLIIFLYVVYATYTIGIKNGNDVLPYRTIFSII